MNAQELYDFTHKYCDDHPYHGAQLHFEPGKAPTGLAQVKYNTQQKIEFVQYLHYHADHWRTDALEGFHRKANGMHLKDFLVYVHGHAFMGIKFVKYPITRFLEHDLWDGGYIEGYVRTMTTPDYFFWSYMKADKLKMILSDYTNELQPMT